MGGGSKQQTQQVQQLQLPQWVQDAGVANYAQAKSITDNNDYSSAYDYKVADTPETQTQGIDLLQQNAGQYGAYDQAGSTYSGLMGYQPGQVAAQGVTAGSLANTNLDPYMNPYVKDVVNTSMDNLEQQRQKAIMSNSSAASAAHAFGGGRAGVVDGVTNSETARQAGDLSANLYKSAFDTATTNANTDINRNLSTDQFNAGQNLDAQKTNVSNDITGAGIRKSSADALASNATAKQGAVDKDYFGLLDAANKTQTQEQNQIDATRANALAPYEFDKDKLNVLLTSLGMTPYNKTMTSNGTTTTSSSPDFATLGLGVLKAGMGFAGF